VLLAQDIQVNRQNKTIAVTADESVTADPEVAVLTLGHRDFAPSYDAAFQQNISASDKITKALMSVGVPIANIETEKLSLERVEPDSRWTPEMKKDRQFGAQQTWQVTVPVSQAQAVVDVAVRNGANYVEDVDWDVADPAALQAKAGGAALAKARLVAEQMARGLGTKLGELIYASNRAPVNRAFRNLSTLETSMAAPAPPPPPPHLKLFLQKVKSQATVYAVFGIE
jgi:uncharacterized protein YggE